MAVHIYCEDGIVLCGKQSQDSISESDLCELGLPIIEVRNDKQRIIRTKDICQDCKDRVWYPLYC